MKAAYVDTSCLLAVAFREPGHDRVRRNLRVFDRLLSTNLLEAEFRAALTREDVPDAVPSGLSSIFWLQPDRPLSPEFDRVLSFGYIRGADLWHLAACLFLRRELPDLAFLTLDERQRERADQLGLEGFPVARRKPR